MKLVVVLSLVAGVSALSLPAKTPALRPSVSAFRARGSNALTLKGGGSDFPVDVDTALMLNTAVFGFYGLLCQPDLNLPIMNLDMKVHTSRNSAFYNDNEPMTESNTKAYRWIANSFFGLSALSYATKVDGNDKAKKSVCKFLSILAAANTALMFINQQPVVCGGPIVAPALAIILGANGFA